MKIRNGFVSNSSSSSFIVAADSEADLKNLKIVTEVDLTRYAEGDPIKTIAQLNEHFKEQHLYRDYTLEEFFEDEPYWKEKYDQMAAAISKGQVVISGCCSDDTGDSVELFLCENGLNGVFGDKVNVIDGDGGY